MNITLIAEQLYSDKFHSDRLISGRIIVSISSQYASHSLLDDLPDAGLVGLQTVVPEELSDALAEIVGVRVCGQKVIDSLPEAC